MFLQTIQAQLLLILIHQYYGVGNHNITYTFTPTGCVPIPVASSILVNESNSIITMINITINNPILFMDSQTEVSISQLVMEHNYHISLNQVLYLLNVALSNSASTGAIFSSGTFNYTVTDNNQCTYSNSVTLYDPLNTSSVMNEYNSSCFGENDGSASLTLLGSTTPPGTVSLLSYCASNQIQILLHNHKQL